MAKRGFFVPVSVVLLIMLVGCSPAVAPIPTATPTFPPTTPASQTQATLTVNPEVVACQEVVKMAQKQEKITLLCQPDTRPGVITNQRLSEGASY